MKKVLVGLLTVVSVSAFAQDYAQVVRVEPRFVTVQQRQCQYVETYGQDNSAAGVIIGGVAGGIIGNQVGKGHGKEAATALGAVTGAIVGGNLGRNNGSQMREECRFVPVTTQQGKTVTFSYQGQVFTQTFYN